MLVGGRTTRRAAWSWGLSSSRLGIPRSRPWTSASHSPSSRSCRALRSGFWTAFPTACAGTFPFLLIGSLLSAPACPLAATAHNLVTVALSVGVLPMTMNATPSFIYTLLVDRRETSVRQITTTREIILNTSRAVATAVGIGLLLVGGSASAVCLLCFLVAGVILLEMLAK